MTDYEYFTITQFVVKAVIERGWEDLWGNLKGELEIFVEYLIEQEIPLDNEYVVQAWLIYRKEVSCTPRFPSPKLRARIFEKFGCQCTLCGSQLNLQIDHIIPYSKFGRTVFENLTVLCEKCNQLKRDRCF